MGTHATVGVWKAYTSTVRVTVMVPLCIPLNYSLALNVERCASVFLGVDRLYSFWKTYTGTLPALPGTMWGLPQAVNDSRLRTIRVRVVDFCMQCGTAAPKTALSLILQPLRLADSSKRPKSILATTSGLPLLVDGLESLSDQKKSSGLIVYKLRSALIRYSLWIQNGCSPSRGSCL